MNALKRLSGPGKWFIAAFAFAAALFTGPALALTISLPGFSCAGATATISGDTVTINCAGSGPLAGTFSLVAPASLGIGTTTTNQIQVARSGNNAWVGTTTILIDVTGTGCTAVTPAVSFVDNDSTPKEVVVTAVSAGSCTVALGTLTGGGSKGSSSANISIVDPNGPVSFQFTATTSATNVGATSSNVITVQRSGGTATEYNVGYTLGGTLTPITSTMGANGSLTGSGTLNFPANSSTATLSYTAPAVAPTIIPGSLTVTLAAPVAVGTPPVGQTSSLGANTVHTLALTGPSTVPSNVLNFPIQSQPAGNWIRMALNPGSVGYSALPDVTTAFPHVSGYIQLGALPSSPGSALLEATISKTIGEINPNAGSCYWTTTNRDVLRMSFIVAPYYNAVITEPIGGRGAGVLNIVDIHDAPTAAAKGFCWAPKSEGTWYVNVRWAPSNCSPYAPPCDWSFQWNLAEY